MSRESIIRHRKAVARLELMDMIKTRLVQETLSRIADSLEFKKCLDCIVDGTKDPYSACDELLSTKLNFRDFESSE